MKDQLREFLSYVDEYIVNGGHFFWLELSSKLGCPFDISPEDFLKISEKHLKEKNYIDALANVKRWIDSQMDMLLFNIWYLDLARKEKWSFPKKVNLFNNFWILAPRILNKINRCRNELEHSFKHPTSEIVEDYLDIAMLFRWYTEKYLLDFAYFVTDGGESGSDWYAISVRQWKINIEFVSQTKDGYRFSIFISDRKKYEYIIKLLIESLDWLTGG